MIEIKLKYMYYLFSWTFFSLSLLNLVSTKADIHNHNGRGAIGTFFKKKQDTEHGSNEKYILLNSALQCPMLPLIN